MVALRSSFSTFRQKYWPLIKSLQTGLLLLTGLAGFMSCRCPIFNVWGVLGIAGSLFLAVSGSTVLNMYIDRDIDAKMDRTCWRPLPSGKISSIEALVLGFILTFAGVSWSMSIDLLYGAIVFAGLFFDVIIYSLWLKRKTPWSILWGGISGGMPILAGRALGYGSVDWVGIAFALSILFWIPTHILTFSMKYHQDYQTAGIPTFPSTYGFKFTRMVIAISSVFAAIAMGVSAHGVSLSWGYMRVLAVLASGLLGLAVMSTFKPSPKINFGLFKYASIFMLSAMVMIVLDVL